LRLALCASARRPRFAKRAGALARTRTTRPRNLAEQRSGYGMLAMRAVELGAAVVIIGFGTLLLAGYIVVERGVGI
jgi:hypothetical protein